MHCLTDSDTNIEIKVVLYFHPGTQIILSVNLIEGEICPICSYFEKGCHLKCMQQPWKVLWVVLSSKKFERMAGEAMDIKSANAKGKEQKQK